MPDCIWESKDTVTVVVTLCAFIISEILGVLNHENKYRSILQVVGGVLNNVLKGLKSSSASIRGGGSIRDNASIIGVANSTV
jgi:hypothetical protein